MNRPPGYYKDERGREYYWDGRTRSYIPDNSYDRFRRDLDRAGIVVVLTSVVLIVGGIVLIPVTIFLIWAAYNRPEIINFITLLALIGGLMYLEVSSNLVDWTP